MKTNTFLISAVLAAAFVVGCQKHETVAEQLDNAKTATKEATQDMKDYTFAQKAEFVQAMQTQLAALDQDLAKLAVKIDNSSEAVKADAKPKLEALQAQAAKLKQQLADATNADESTWSTVKTNSHKALDELKAGFAQSRQWLSDKIAP